MALEAKKNAVVFYNQWAMLPAKKIHEGVQHIHG